MVWYTWRRHRLGLAGVGLLALAVTAVATIMTASGRSPDTVRLAQQALPLLAGVVLGVPLFAREREHGLHRLTLGRTPTRSRWLLAPIATLLLPVLLGTGLLVALYTPAAYSELRWYDEGRYALTGLVPFGHVTFALVLGAVAGLVLGRTVPALVATVVGALGMRIAVGVALPSLWPHRTRLLPLESMSLGAAEAWGRDIGLMRADGTRTDFRATSCSLSDVPCLNADGLVARYVSEIPASSSAALPAVEFAIFVVLAALMLGGALAWTRHRAF